MSDPLQQPQAEQVVSRQAARPQAFDARLRSYMLGVYNYMASGLFLTGIIALWVANTASIREFFFLAEGAPTGLGWFAIVSPLALVFALSFGLNRFSERTTKAMFWSFAGLMGVSLSTVVLAYTGVSIARTFFVAASAFAGLSLWGYTTKKDLSAWGSFLMMGVFGLIIAMIVNMFLRSSAMDFVVSGIGVLLFAGLTAYDTQKIKNIYFKVTQSDARGKVIVMGALTLYLDFINLFLFLLRFMGQRR